MNHLIIYDEGIIHNSGFGSEEESSPVLKNHIYNETGVIPIGMIYCYMSGEEYFKRRKARITQGKGIFSDRNLNDKELNRLCYRSLKSAEDTVRVLKKYEVQVLELDTGNSIMDNAKKAHEFIKSFQCDTTNEP